MNTRLASQPRSISRTDVFGLAMTGVVYAVVMALLIPALRQPDDVDQVTVDNPHPWDVNVAVTDGERDGWLGIGVLEPGTEQSFASVLDQGEQWIFRFSYGGEQAEAQLSGAQLARDGWQVTVPDELADNLRAAGVPEAPR
ncbi:MAG: hypothetical protein ACRD2C_17375 [Acidimicrobiales bacterium]